MPRDKWVNGSIDGGERDPRSDVSSGLDALSGTVKSLMSVASAIYKVACDSGTSEHAYIYRRLFLTK